MTSPITPPHTSYFYSPPPSSVRDFLFSIYHFGFLFNDLTGLLAQLRTRALSACTELNDGAFCPWCVNVSLLEGTSLNLTRGCSVILAEEKFTPAAQQGCHTAHMKKTRS